MNYKSFENLSIDIREWLKDLPDDYDLIVGIPRSGILPATLIALYKNLPLTDVEGLIQKRVLYPGKRLVVNNVSLFKRDRLKILIVDDSISSGSQLETVKNKVHSLLSDDKYIFHYGVVYTTRKSRHLVDFFYEVLKHPRCFEWNIFHSAVLKKSCVDIDGILCRDPTKNENDDGSKYVEFIKNVKPLIIPTVEIGWLVTCRLEKYREMTEEWLKKYGIKYDQLYMMDIQDKETRIALSNYAEYKAKIYKETRAEFFLESSKEQAIKIARICNKDVYCYEDNKVYKPNSKLNTGMIEDENPIFFRMIKKIKKLFNTLI